MLPAIAELCAKTENAGTDLALPLFRALALARLAGIWPKQVPEEERVDATIFSSRGWQTAANNAAAHAAGLAAGNAANTAGCMNTDGYAARARDTLAWARTAIATVAGPAGNAAAAALLNEVKHDAARIEAGDTWLVLPLWQSSDPSTLSMRNGSRDLWRHLQKARSENWLVWQSWYDGIFRGDPPDLYRERCYVFLENAAWEDGPIAVNADIEAQVGRPEVRVV